MFGVVVHGDSVGRRHCAARFSDWLNPACR
jgi:hypothetical protein